VKYFEYGDIDMTQASATKQIERNGKGFGAAMIYQTLRGEILSLTLKPSELIDEASLAARFGVSRSPVREAMVRLVSESLLQTLPNKGTIIAPLRIEEFPQYVDALDLVQRTVTRLAAGKRTQENLLLIKEEQRKYALHVANGNILGMIQGNRDFHMAIAAATNNRYLEQIYLQLLDDGQRPLRLYFESYNNILPAEAIDHHEEMIAAIDAQDVDLAERIAQEHTTQMQQRFLNYLGYRQTSDIRVSL
jgi:DNA-binding GntR family transcriptional regulator